MNEREMLDKFVEDRDKTILSLDKAKILAFYKKYDMNMYTSNEQVFWGGIHKAILGITSATDEQKSNSKQWLIENGFKPTIQGRNY